MTHTLVSSSPPLKILPLELKLISKCVVCKEWGENLYLSVTQIQVFSKCVTFPFNHTCLIMHVSNSMIIVNVSNYDHVEQFISSSAMIKAAADNKSPNLSIGCPMDCYPKMAKQFPCPRHLFIQVSLLFSTIL